MPLHAAVCLTGLERSFVEVGLNVREGLFTMLRGAVVSVFGVQPAKDAWKEIPTLIPLHGVAMQQPCWTPSVQNETIRWMHCDMRLRKGDCRLSFLQALCDLQACERLISEHEQRMHRRFDVVVRLRADLFWENAVPLPLLEPNVVYVPAMDTPGGEVRGPGRGVNDHLAVGTRDAMAKYLTRARHVSRPGISSELRGSGSEQYLASSLRWDGVRAVRMQEWMYCPHTPRNLLRGAATTGCIARVRCRTGCRSLFCPHAAAKADQCECFDEDCSTFAARNSSSSMGRTAAIGPGWLGRGDQERQFRHWRNPSPRDVSWKDWCVDFSTAPNHPACMCSLRRFLPHRCVDFSTAERTVPPPPEARGNRAPVRQLFHSWHDPCAWRNITDGRVHSIMHLSAAARRGVEPAVTAVPVADVGVLLRAATIYFGSPPEGIDTGALPLCFFPSAALIDQRLTSRDRVCRREVHSRHFIGEHGRFNVVSS